jgi:HEAT repeat protein
MCQRRWFFPAAILFAIVVWPSTAFAPDESKNDRANIRIAQKQIRSQDVTERIDGIKRLRDLPAKEASKLIVSYGLADPEDEVRRAAYEALLTWTGDRQTEIFLLTTLEKETRANKENITLIAPIIGVLIASELPETQHDLSKFLDGYTASSQNGIAAIILVADELGKQADKQSLASLQKIAALKCFSDSFACRRAVIQSMILIHQPKAVEALIALLPETEAKSAATSCGILSPFPANGWAATQKSGRTGGKRTRKTSAFRQKILNLLPRAWRHPMRPTITECPFKHAG